jgi:hypothetical protein
LRRVDHPLSAFIPSGLATLSHLHGLASRLSPHDIPAHAITIGTRDGLVYLIRYVAAIWRQSDSRDVPEQKEIGGRNSAASGSYLGWSILRRHPGSQRPEKRRE